VAANVRESAQSKVGSAHHYDRFSYDLSGDKRSRRGYVRGAPDGLPCSSEHPISFGLQERRIDVPARRNCTGPGEHRLILIVA
jgi:hypothetical protein